LSEPLDPTRRFHHSGAVVSPEAQRHDLYNGLSDLLGEERAGVLMTYLPATQTDNLATKDDISQLRLSVTELGRKVDRILFALIAGLVAVVATLVSQLPG
jgi:hypothetical protein